jgi:hypothetical protein
VAGFGLNSYRMQSIILCETDANQVRPTPTLSPLTLISGFRAPKRASTAGKFPIPRLFVGPRPPEAKAQNRLVLGLLGKDARHIFVQLRDRRLKALRQDSSDLGRRQLPFARESIPVRTGGQGTSSRPTCLEQGSAARAVSSSEKELP